MKLSTIKKERIYEQIFLYLYRIYPKNPFTAEIAREVIRDEEFIKKILFELKDKNLIIALRKNSKGVVFTRKIKWKLPTQIYDIYHSKQHLL